MDAKTYLRQIEMYNVRIEQMNEQLLRLDAIVNGTTGSMDAIKVQTSLDKNKREKQLARLADLKNKIIDKKIEQEEKRAEIVDMIHQLTNPQFIKLLTYRYIECIPLKDVPDVMTKPDGGEYSYDHINRLHGQALNAFREIYNNVMQMPCK